ncbi:MAG: hypothetical protein K0R57_3059 [Paenibacillaceae bacterium]|jgi:hypothetical protein|nr:hypothetical protein [Paenibacillaceae bacterium]
MKRCKYLCLFLTFLVMLQLGMPVLDVNTARVAAEDTAIEIIVDNQDEGFSASEGNNKWYSSTSTREYIGSDYLTNGNQSSQPNKWAMFTPDIPAEGNYKVYMWWPNAGGSGNRSSAAPLEVKHKNGTYYSTVNQNATHSKWVHIGTFTFAEGTGSYVRITGADPGYTTVDAFKFEYTLEEPYEPSPSPSPSPTPTPSPTPNPGQTAPIAPGLDGQLAARFPLYQASVNRVLAGDNRGFGMLAQYEESAPQEVYFSRTTEPVSNEPFDPAAHVKVFDPQGNMVLYHDFSGQPAGKQELILPIPAGQAGIWTFSFTGGRNGDLLEIGLPATDIWGVRGEMALGITETTPKKAYVYLADITQQDMHPNYMPKLTSGFFFLEAFGNAPSISLRNQAGNVVGTLANSGGRNVIDAGPAPAGEVWSLDLAGWGGYILIDGTPGLLTPSVEAALALKGGTVEAEGFVVAGPLQARLMEKMVEISGQNLDVELDFPEEVPDDLENPLLEVLAYGRYGTLQGLDYVFRHQILDPADPAFGMVLDKQKQQLGLFSGGMAAAVTVPGQLNPAYGNEALLNRAVLNSLSFLVWLQGDFAYKDRNLREVAGGPNQLYFAAIGPQAVDPYLMLHDKVDPATAALWKEAVTAVLDKYADMRNYLSNQWTHNILAQLYMHEATGEERFLKNFERMIVSFIDGTHGPGSRLGQHPAGFYLEEYGPDGNYESMSSYHIMDSYRVYKNTPGFDPVILAKLKSGIERNLTFKSFYWLPQPDGSMASPTAINTRTNTPIHIATYPGDIMGRADFALSLRRYQMWPGPSEDPADLAGGDIMAHRINTEEWALKVLNALLPLKSGSQERVTYWPHAIYESYTQPITVEPADLPIDSTYGTWELPGQIAWKRGELYGVVLYDVPGVTRVIPQAHLGGGPTVLWGNNTGSVVSSLRNSKAGAVAGPEDIVHSGIFGKDSNGQFFYSGKERTTLTWIVPDRIFELRSPLSSPQGELVWRYELDDEETRITVSLNLQEQAQEAFITLPIASGLANTEPHVFENNKLKYQAGSSSMILELPQGAQAQLLDEVTTPFGKARNLQIALASDGTPLTISVYMEDCSEELQ